MTTSDRAADVIRNHGTNTCQKPECIAQDLADADLLAPDLPEPDARIDNPAHRRAYIEEYGNLVGVPNIWKTGIQPITKIQTFPNHDNYVHIYDELEPREPITADEARTLAHALLAAANYAEQTKTPPNHLTPN